MINCFVKVRDFGGLTFNQCGGDELQNYLNTILLKMFECKSCGNSFSVFADAIFEKSSTLQNP